MKMDILLRIESGDTPEGSCSNGAAVNVFGGFHFFEDEPDTLSISCIEGMEQG